MGNFLTHNKPSTQSYSRQQMFRYVGESTIPINDGDAKGSAFLVKMTDGSSVVCTAGHILSATPSLYNLGPKINPNFDFALLSAAGNLGYEDAKFDYGTADDIELGDTVYYGGYPFSTRTPHIHKGTISAIDEDILGRRSFKIDGTAVKGMSGGPIFVQKYDALSNSYIPVIIGFLASETFDPVKDFESALKGLAGQIKELQIREDHNRDVQEDVATGIQENNAKILRNHFSSDELQTAFASEPDSDSYQKFIWEDLHNANILTEEGRLNNVENFSKQEVQHALREEYKKHAKLVMNRLNALKKAMTTRPEDLEGADLLNTIPEEPTDHLARVGMSLVNSLSTGIVTGYFLAAALQNMVDFDVNQHLKLGSAQADEFDIGRKYDLLFHQEKSKTSNAGLSDTDIDEKVIKQVTTMAGLYGEMLPYAKQGKVESDHFPPKSVYKMAKHDFIKKLSHLKMPSLNLRCQDHRHFITTGSGKAANAFRKRQEQFFAQGNYVAAIDINLEEYQKAKLITEENKAALKKGLDLHQKNGLLTPEYRNDLIIKYDLEKLSVTSLAMPATEAVVVSVLEESEGSQSAIMGKAPSTMAPTSVIFSHRPLVTAAADRELLKTEKTLEFSSKQN